MKIYAFDVDDTLEVSSGPVSILSVGSLKAEGHIVGLNGNWAGGSSVGAAVASHFQFHWAHGNVEEHFSEPAKNVYSSRRLHHGRKHQRSKRRIR